MLKGPDDLLLLRDSIIASISFELIDLRSKEFSTVYYCPEGIFLSLVCPHSLAVEHHKVLI